MEKNEQNEQNFKAKALVVTLEEITPERAAECSPAVIGEAREGKDVDVQF